MAKLPTAADVTGTVQPIALPRPRLSKEAFGANLGAATTQLAQAVDQLIDQEVRTNNETEAQALVTAFNTRARLLENGDGTKENPGYKSRLNKTALDERGGYEQKLDDFRKSLQKQASNSVVLQAFNRAADNRQSTYLNSIATHYNAQRKGYREQVWLTTRNEAVESAIADPDDPNHVQDVYLGSLRYYQEQKGLDFKTAKSLAEEERSKAHAAVINDLVKTDAMRADDYFKANVGEIDTDLQKALKETLKGGVIKARAIKRIDEIRINEGLDTAAKRLEAAKTEKNPDLRDELVTRVRALNTDIANAEKDELKETTSEIYKAIDKGNINTLLDIPGDQRAVLERDPRVIANVERFIKRKAEKGQGFAEAYSTETDNQLHELEMMADKSQFLDFNLPSIRSKMTKNRYEYWQARQASYNKADLKEKAKVASYTLGDRIAKEYLLEAGINVTSSASKTHAAHKNAVTKLVRDLIDEKHEEGKKASREEIERLVARATLKVNYDSWRSDEFRFQAVKSGETFQLEDRNKPATQRRISTALGIDARHIGPIIESLEKHDKRITLDNIQATYEAAVRRNEEEGP